MRTIAASVGLFAVSAALFIGCGGIGLRPGEYTTLRIASSSATQTGDWGQMTPNDTVTTNIRGGATVLVWGATATNGDIFFLDDGKDVFQGAQQADGSYLFAGKRTETQVQGQATTTSVTSETVTFTVTGDNVSGTTQTTQTASCAGQCGGFNTTTCTSNSSFVGVHVQGDDVQQPA